MAAHEIGRMFLSLGLVLALIWLFARLARSRQGVKMGRAVLPGGGATGTAGRIEMLGRKNLGRHTSIAVVRVSDRTLVVGLTPQHINVLTELTEHDHGIVGLTPLTEQDVELLGSVVPALGVSHGHDAPMPWPASEAGAPAPKAWDALVDGLREMTIRR